MQARALLGLPGFVSCFVLACASAPKEPESAPPPAAEVATTEKPTEPEPELSDEAAALIAESEGKAPPPKSEASPAAETPSGNEKTGHELVYRVRSDGLSIEVLGAKFVPSVKAKKLKNGYGIDIELTGETKGDVVLATTGNGPIALAVHKKGKDEILADKKSEGDDVTLSPGSPKLYRRSWPSEGNDGILPGEEAEFQVGLWGLGKSAAEKKPVRRFFVVTLKVDKKGATVSVNPPKNPGK